MRVVAGDHAPNRFQLSRGLDSFPGTIIGAFIVGILESFTAGYVGPLVGGGFSHVASYLVLIATLFVRPYGLFRRPDVERV